MDFSTAELFVILALSPEKGRVSLDSIHFRYTLTGAILMDYLEGEEIKVEDKRVIPSLRLNDDAIHNLFADRIMKSSRNRRISYWIKRLTNKSRFIFSEMIKILEKRRIIRIEQKKFLNIFPYKRYWFLNTSARDKTIEDLRMILLHGKQPSKKEVMLLGIIESSKCYSILSREKGEAKILRKKNTEILKGDIMSSEINQAIREVQAAVAASVITASSSH